MPGRRNKEEKIQTIGGKNYCLKESSGKNWPAKIGSGIVAIALAPIMVPILGLLSIAMATPWKETLFKMFIPKIMAKVDEDFEEERTQLLSTISGGSVLDVGSGAGASYFRYFAKANKVVAVEPQTIMYPKLKQVATDHGLDHGPGKEFTIVGDLQYVVVHETFDQVVLGNVLCEVPNVDEALDQVDKLLKVGGRVYFSEHIGRPTGTWTRWWQDVCNPWHRHITLGCHCNRDSLEKICSQQNWDVVFWQYEHLQVFMGPFVLGLAVKKA